MFDLIRKQVLRFVRVPAEPEPPAGAVGSIRVFRAGRNYYKLRLARWGITQIGAVIGIIFSLSFLYYFESQVAFVKATALRAAQEQAAAPALSASSSTVTPSTGQTVASPETKAVRVKEKKRKQDNLIRFATRWPDWVFPLLHLIEYAAILFLIVQLPFTYAAVRLEFEQHWYIVTDRSLRIRTGLLALTESTMSFANIQQVEVKQGPLQRLLGLADVHVQSAGGGEQHAGKGGESLHTGVFHSVEHATEIRNLILERLRRFREAGLGDPEDRHALHVEPPALAQANDTLTAARELLSEAKALREALR